MPSQIGPSRTLILLLLSFLTLGLGSSAGGALEFQDYPGIETCAGGEAAAAVLKVGIVSFDGGRVRKSLVAGKTGSAYASDSQCGGDRQTITITFKYGVQNVNFLIWDGHQRGLNPYPYTITDDLGNVEISTVSGNSNYQSVSSGYSSAANIRRITITPGPFVGPCIICDPETGKPTWGFAITGLTFTSPFLTIDPSPYLLDSFATNGIRIDASNPSEGNIASGIAADGAARLILAIRAEYVGQKLSLQLYGDEGQSTSIERNGYLGSIDSPPDKALRPTTIIAIKTGEGPMAFAIYYAPLDFTFPGQNYEAQFERGVEVSIGSPNTPGYENFVSLTVIRPPVFLVHGLWGEPSNWQKFIPLLNDPRRGPSFTVVKIDYSMPVIGEVTSRNPPTSENQQVRQNQLGLDYNAQGLFTQIATELVQYRSNFNAAAVRIDVVAHSMGGLIIRNLQSFEAFSGRDSYGQGLVHKIITIGTPHFGSPIATALLPGETTDPNRCVRRLFAFAGLAAYKNVTVDSESFRGAVADISGDGYGQIMNPTLERLRASSRHDIPTALIAGTMDTRNLSGLDCTGCKAALLRFACPSDFLSTSLTEDKWPAVFRSRSNNSIPQSDGIVSLPSQFAGLSGFVFPGVVHSTGLVKSLSFNGPEELNSPDVAMQVSDLLNRPVKDAAFSARP